MPAAHGAHGWLVALVQQAAIRPASRLNHPPCCSSRFLGHGGESWGQVKDRPVSQILFSPVSVLPQSPQFLMSVKMSTHTLPHIFLFPAPCARQASCVGTLGMPPLREGDQQERSCTLASCLITKHCFPHSLPVHALVVLGGVTAAVGLVAAEVLAAAAGLAAAAATGLAATDALAVVAEPWANSRCRMPVVGRRLTGGLIAACLGGEVMSGVAAALAGALCKEGSLPYPQSWQVPCPTALAYDYQKKGTVGHIIQKPQVMV